MTDTGNRLLLGEVKARQRVFLPKQCLPEGQQVYLHDCCCHSFMGLPAGTNAKR